MKLLHLIWKAYERLSPGSEESIYKLQEEFSFWKTQLNEGFQSTWKSLEGILRSGNLWVGFNWQVSRFYASSWSAVVLFTVRNAKWKTIKSTFINQLLSWNQIKPLGFHLVSFKCFETWSSWVGCSFKTSCLDWWGLMHTIWLVWTTFK